ncbi:MAG: hypothetical protein KF898_00160 [Parachlamydiales bacterium]|nr:hypothetical protein [Candidatus Acheromyda pituitae]
MATKAIPDSTGINVEAAAMKLTQDIMHGCSQVGELRAESRAIGEDLRQGHLSQETFGKTQHLARQVNYLAESAMEWELSLGSEPISSIDGLARQLLTAQFSKFNEELQGLKRNVSYTVEDVIYSARKESQELQPVFEKAVGQYLQTRNAKDAESAKECGGKLNDFNHGIADLTYTCNRLNDRKIEHIYQRNPVEERTEKLERLIGQNCYHTTVTTLFLKLDQVAEEGDVAALDDRWGMNKERINGFIDDLHEQVGSDQVNYWVWNLLGEKPGENYGQVHRYDDLGVLKEAILRTSKSLVDKIMKEEAADLGPEAVYAKLYEIIGEPEVENPMVWMKENACYYTRELHDAIDAVKFPRRDFQLFDDFDPFPATFDFNPSGLPIDFSQPPRLFLPPQKHEYTSIFEELDGASTVQPELRDRIEAMIERLSGNGLADTINYEIWRLGGQKPGDNWGVVHRYDDPAVLRQALMIAVRRDVHNEMVVKRFDDDEDRNAFYAEITAIAFEDEYDGVPSDIDPIAYGKENIVFHLHRISEASEVVQARIERRREEKARESDEAMGEIIEAAIAKNPAAQSLADMLKSIGQATSIFARTGAVEECKAQIKAKIEGSDFSEDLRQQIFIGIWRANEEPTGDSAYGLHHYLDNLEVLSQVLLNIVVEIAINGEQ